MVENTQIKSIFSLFLTCIHFGLYRISTILLVMRLLPTVYDGKPVVDSHILINNTFNRKMDVKVVCNSECWDCGMQYIYVLCMCEQYTK